MISNPFASAINNAKLGWTADTTVVADKFVEIGRYTVPAGSAICLGYGVQSGMDNAVGRCYIKLIDDTAGDATEEHGLLRLEVRDPQDRPVEVLWEARTEQTGASTTQNLKIPFPEHAAKFGEDWALVLLFKSDAADIIQWDFSKVLFDITIYTAR